MVKKTGRPVYLDSTQHQYKVKKLSFLPLIKATVSLLNGMLAQSFSKTAQTAETAESTEPTEPTEKTEKIEGKRRKLGK